MISIINTVKMTDLSVVSACSLGVTCASASSPRGTGMPGMSGSSAVSPLFLPILPVRERSHRPVGASAAAVAKGRASAYAFAAAGAGIGAEQQTTQHHTKWAFRGPEPWSDPA